MDALRPVLDRDPRIAYALLFGSGAGARTHARSDVDIAIGLESGVVLDARDVGALVADLERAAGRPVDLVILDEAPSSLAYRAFGEGTVIMERNHRALAERKARAILEYLDFRLNGSPCAGRSPRPPVVDKTVLAVKTAALRDAVSRIREVVPARLDDFVADRTAREIVALNLRVGRSRQVLPAARRTG